MTHHSEEDIKKLWEYNNCEMQIIQRIVNELHSLDPNVDEHANVVLTTQYINQYAELAQDIIEIVKEAQDD